MIDQITKEQIETWRRMHKTPAGGQAYFSDEMDVCAVIYPRVTKLFFSRNREGFTPHCFNEVREIHPIPPA